MNSNRNLQFLVAMPTLKDSFFEAALILLIEHDKYGAWGLMVNQPSKFKKHALLKELNPSFQKDSNTADQALYIGGPVDAEHGFVLHKPCEQFEGEQLLTPELAVSCRQSLLQAHAHGADIGGLLIAFGYCGWSEGQLAQEINANSWLEISCDGEAVLQQNHDQRVSFVLSKLGIEYQQLSSIAGHS